MGRIIGQADVAADEQFCATTVSSLNPEVITALDRVIASADDGDLDADACRAATFVTELKTTRARLV